ncbi:MAG: sugar phosphate isomerase/epimerase family protein [Methanomicrobiales archaeon]|nr:sugar phosphate isomerase/epimerase family protein [Methanomicrobiales archaeon]
MRIGVSTWCLLDRTLGEALECLSSRVKEVEILSDASHDLLHAGVDCCSSFDLRYSVHAPVTDLNIASCRERVREVSLDILEEVCERAAVIDASCVVVHPGFMPWMELRERSLACLHRSLKRLSGVQEEQGIRIAVENMGSWEVCHFRDTSLLPAIRELGLGFCLDIGHAHINGALEEFLHLAEPDHVHVHDNHGREDDHLAPGEGGIDFNRIAVALPAGVPWIEEVHDLRACDSGLLHLSRLHSERDRRHTGRYP